MLTDIMATWIKVHPDKANFGSCCCTPPCTHAQEKWFHDPRKIQLGLSEPSYDIMIQDMCQALMMRIQFSKFKDQREVALSFFHVQAELMPEIPLPKKTNNKTRQGRNTNKKSKYMW